MQHQLPGELSYGKPIRLQQEKQAQEIEKHSTLDRMLYGNDPKDFRP